MSVETPDTDTDADTDTEPLWWDPQTLRELYLDEGLTRQEVADRLGCARSTVDDWLARHDIRRGDTNTDSEETITLDAGQARALKYRPTAAAKLLRLEDPFYRQESDLSHRAFAKFRVVGVIHHAGPQEVYQTGGGTSLRYPWAVRDGIRSWVKQRLDLRGDCPGAGCFATGVKNLRDGRYACRNEDCDAEFGRETALEVLGL